MAEHSQTFTEDDKLSRIILKQNAIPGIYAEIIFMSVLLLTI